MSELAAQDLLGRLDAMDELAAQSWLGSTQRKGRRMCGPSLGAPTLISDLAAQDLLGRLDAMDELAAQSWARISARDDQLAAQVWAHQL